MIYDEEKVKEWISKVLPPLRDDEVFLLLLIARKKDFPEMKKDFIVLRQLIKEGTPDEILEKIKIIKCNLPQECLSIQIDPNPHSTLKAFQKFVNKYLNLALFEQDKTKFRKIDEDLFSAIHTSYSRKIYILLDLDSKENFDKVIKITEPILDTVVSVVETKGGYHFILKKDSEKLKILYKDLREKLKDFNVEILSTFTTPIPGTIQRGFRVKEVKIF